MMIRFWVVAGEDSTGKSTTVGHLIGQTKRGFAGSRLVRTKGGGYLSVYARRQSRQEANHAPFIVVKDIKKIAEGFSGPYFNTVLAMRINAYNGQPDAMTYIKHFVDSGWEIQSIALLMPDAPQVHSFVQFGVPVLAASDALIVTDAHRKHGWTSGLVRSHFGWA